MLRSDNPRNVLYVYVKMLFTVVDPFARTRRVIEVSLVYRDRSRSNGNFVILLRRNRFRVFRTRYVESYFVFILARVSKPSVTARDELLPFRKRGRFVNRKALDGVSLPVVCKRIGIRDYFQFPFAYGNAAGENGNAVILAYVNVVFVFYRRGKVVFILADDRKRRRGGDGYFLSVREGRFFA